MSIVLNGIELLNKIKTHTITNDNIIKVIKDNNVVCYLKYKDNELQCNNTFNISMILDDNYSFVIIDTKPVKDALLDIGINETYAIHIIRYIDTLVFDID